MGEKRKESKGAVVWKGGGGEPKDRRGDNVVNLLLALTPFGLVPPCL